MCCPGFVFDKNTLHKKIEAGTPKKIRILLKENTKAQTIVVVRSLKARHYITKQDC